jgi:hypothetical protein
VAEVKEAPGRLQRENYFLRLEFYQRGLPVPARLPDGVSTQQLVEQNAMMRHQLQEAK